MRHTNTMFLGLMIAGAVGFGMNASAEAAAVQEHPAAAVQQQDEHLAGGWQVTEGSTKLDKHSKQVFAKALDGLVGCKYEPVALLGKQVVAGTNYCFLCRLTPVVLHPTAHWAMVYINEDLQGHASLQQVQDMPLGQTEDKNKTK